MGEQENLDATAVVSSAGEVEALCRRFKNAWDEALNGGARPRVELFLAHTAEPQRSALRRVLQLIEQEYEPRWAQQHPRPDYEANTEAEENSSPRIGTDVTENLNAPPRPDLGETRDAVAVPPHADDPGFALSEPTQMWARRTTEDESGAPAEFVANLSGGGTEPPSAPPEGSPAARGPSGAARPAVAGYEILAELGRGGMGVVYKARQLRLNRLVALKMVLAGAHAGGQQLARFHAEAEAVAQLQHPNIVQIFEVGEHEGLPFFSLEFVDGGSLAQKLGGKPRPPREAAGVVELLALAMAEAHQHGIIHRDLKPANVLLTADGLPKLTDFGLAKRLEGDSELTKSGTIMGSPSYMSPEQARGEQDRIGPLSDLYGLGAILYELLTGRPPFVGTSMLETLYQVRHEEPVPPSRFQPKVPRDLETICLKCLQKEPANRYVGCEALAEDLHRFLIGEPIRARPVGRGERLWRWCRRNPRTAALSGAIGVLLCAVAVSLTVIGVRVSGEQRAVAETRKVAGQRLEQATAAIASGDYRQAQDILQRPDPLLMSSAGLGDVRTQWDTLRDQVDVYAQFRRLLDDARFACRFGSVSEKQRGRELCRQLLELYDEIEQRTGRAAAGLPPLDERQQQLFKEDVFEALLTAALVEQDLAGSADPAARQQAARQAIDWLNLAEQVVPQSRALHVHRASFWEQLGDGPASKADTDQAAAIKPTSAVDRFWHGFAEHARGEGSLKQGDRKAAEEQLRAAIADYAAFLQLRPDHYWGYFNWANCHVLLGDLHDALVGFTACIRLRPDFPWPYNNRGTAHLRLGELDQAVEDYSTALDRNSQYAEAYANRGTTYRAEGKLDLALSDLTRAVELDPDRAESYAERAEIYRSGKQYAEAIQDYTRLAALSGNKGLPYMKRAEMYRALKRTEEAIQDYDRVIALNPRDVQAYYTRAGLHLARGDYREAVDDYSQVIDLAPRAAGTPDVLRTRAIITWFNLKDFDASLADWERLAELRPADPEPHRCIGVIRLGRRQYDQALQALQTALTLKPDYTEAIWARAQVYLWQGKLQEALAEVDPVVAKLPPDKPETLNIRGDVYRALGRLEEAAADYRRMIELRPKAPDAYVSLAMVYEKQGKLEQAKTCYDQLVAADPGSAVGYLHRAEFRRNHGEFDAALADCAAAAGKDPQSALPELVRAGIEATQGRHPEAVDRAGRALQRAPKDDGHVLYVAACVWSLASRAAAAEPDRSKAGKLAGQYADRATALLTQTLDKGFHDLIYPEHNRMAEDPALAPIRQRPGVGDLLAHRS
jgi:tetratricopeptide (TPR) repeat protein/tRNA A-37 threonylcarbamoyl transferase component Bud32